MSLNNISLPSQLIADLYQKALVQDTARPVPVNTEVPFLGNNGKNILIVVNKQEAPFLPDHELSFLTNILSACQLGLMDVAIVNWQNTRGTNAAGLLAQLKSRQVILFDVETPAFGLPVNVKPYTVIQHDAHQLVSAPSLTEIEKSKEAKKQLWMALKQLFGV